MSRRMAIIGLLGSLALAACSASATDGNGEEAGASSQDGVSSSGGVGLSSGAELSSGVELSSLALSSGVAGSSSTVAASSAAGVSYGSVTDARDSKTYKTVTMGTQVWMAENLDFGTFVANGRNGTNQSDATNASAQKYCYGDTERSCTLTYGGLYQWHTAMALPFSCDSVNADATNVTATCYVNPVNHRGICPQGWHVPTQAEWVALKSWTDVANGGAIDDEGTSLKITKMWDRGIAPGGTDDYGWGAIPAGYRFNRIFDQSQSFGYWWSASESAASGVWSRRLITGNMILNEIEATKSYYGLSIRCLKDSP